MKVSEMKEKSVEELNVELLNLKREHFNMRMQKGTDQLEKTHRIKEVRRDVARVKTIITQKAGS